MWSPGLGSEFGGWLKSYVLVVALKLPKHAGEVSCPESLAGNRVSHIPLPSPDPLEDQKQKEESRCVPLLKILPLGSDGISPKHFKCRILCFLFVLTPSLDPFLGL